MKSEIDARRQQLFKAVDAGLKAKGVCEFLFPILDRQKAALVEKLESNNFYYQKIDNSELLVIQLELKLIKQIKTEASCIESAGEEAAEALRELNQPKPTEKVSRIARY